MSCPHCGYEADPDQAECPLCGTPLRGGGSEEERDVATGSAPGGVSAASGPAEARGARVPGRELTPWEAEGFGGLIDSWWESLSDPGGFFSRVDWAGGLERPLLYYLLFVILGAGLSAVWTALLGQALGSAVGVEGAGVLGWSPLFRFFVSPFLALASLGFTALAVHAGVRLLADQPRRLGATVRTLCYAAGPQALLVVPVVGGIVALIWSIVLAVLGLGAAHRITGLRAAVALFLAFALMTVGTVVAVLLLLTAGFDGLLPVPAS